MGEVTKTLKAESKVSNKDQLDARFCSCAHLILQEDWEDHQIVCSNRRYKCPGYLGYLSFQKRQGNWDYSLKTVDSNCPTSLKELAKLKILQNLDGDLESLNTNVLPMSIVYTLHAECPTFSSYNDFLSHLSKGCPYLKVKCLIKSQFYKPWTEYLDGNWQLHTSDSFERVGLSRWNFTMIDTHKMSHDTISHRSPPIPFLYPLFCPYCSHYFPENTTIHLCSNNSTSPAFDDEILCFSCKKPLENPRKFSRHQLENNCKYCNIPQLPSPRTPISDLSVLCMLCKNILEKPRNDGGILKPSSKVDKTSQRIQHYSQKNQSLAKVAKKRTFNHANPQDSMSSRGKDHSKSNSFSEKRGIEKIDTQQQNLNNEYIHLVESASSSFVTNNDEIRKLKSEPETLQPSPSSVRKKLDVLKRGHNYVTDVVDMHKIIAALNDKEDATIERKLERSRYFFPQGNPNEEKSIDGNNIEQVSPKDQRKQLPKTQNKLEKSILARKEMINKVKSQIINKKKEKQKKRKQARHQSKETQNADHLSNHGLEVETNLHANQSSNYVTSQKRVTFKV
ncbi:hypothetical protein G9A89_012297 [Geosiphon pyriformis]|nr:hypothetical protein G9A89_012297 [Geosiphon pyriformis]